MKNDLRSQMDSPPTDSILSPPPTIAATENVLDRPQPDQNKLSKPSPVADTEKDAGLKGILFYALGGVPAGLTDQFYGLWNFISLVILGINPLLYGFILAVKTLWDSVLDPLIAYLSDNCSTRWGRRIPFIVPGIIAVCLLSFLMVIFFPHKDALKSNVELRAQKSAQTASLASSQITRDSAASDRSQNETEKATPPTTAKAIAAVPAPTAKPWSGLLSGLHSFVELDNPVLQTILLYLLVCTIAFSTLTAVFSVPYYALGIEICPSYDGRTRVVTYRAALGKLVGIIGLWVLPFCMLPIFHNVLGGLFWYALATLLVGTAIAMAIFFGIKEHPVIPLDKKHRISLLKSMWQTAKNIHFLKILFLYQCIGFINSIFAQVGMFLTIYWVFRGDALSGAIVGGYAGTLAMGIAFLALPLINWSCRKFEKHRTLRFAIIWMSVGTALKWVLLTPDYPYLQLILPFFFSLGISSVYTVLPSMMADVTDIDELRNGVRREGMFGAVMGFLMKAMATMQPIIAGGVVVFSGFDVTLGANQPDEVIFLMRLMFSLIPAFLLLLAVFALWRYPLTREHMESVKAELLRRRADAALSALPHQPALS